MTKAFNTGRQYSANGQRIAWTVLSTGNVAMVDVDRGIDYVLVVAEPSNSGVLAAYDASAFAPYNAEEYNEAHIANRHLEQLARSI